MLLQVLVIAVGVLLAFTTIVRVAAMAGWIKNPTAVRLFLRIGQFGVAFRAIAMAASFVGLLVIAIILMSQSK